MTPRPTPPRDPRLDELFVRYWDNALGEAEAAELDRRLATDPAAREWFRVLSLQAAVAAEGAAVARVNAPVRSGWSRRRVLGYLGAGLAAGVAGVVIGRRVSVGGTDGPAEPVRLAALNGEVLVRGADGQTLTGARAVPPGGTVSTSGANSSAVLAYADGTAVALAGDSALTVAATGRRLNLSSGYATADVRRPGTLVLATTVATLSGLADAVTTLGQAVRSTEVWVHRGRVTVSDPAGDELAVVGAGEQLTVQDGGGLRRQPLPDTPDNYAWDLTRPLPDGWAVGTRRVTAAGPVVVPEYWEDPYYGGVAMYQVRSHQPWATGFFRFHRDSRVRVRYRATDTGPGQVCFCVRRPDPRLPETGMLEYNGTFEETPAGRWQTLDIPATDLLDNKHAPTFDAPWVGFLVIFNTYEADLGLEVMEFRVTRPGGAAD